MRCANIFPKPNVECGIFNAVNETFSQVFLANIDRSYANIRFNVQLSFNIQAKIIENKKNSVMKCFVSVPHTDWKTGDTRPLFEGMSVTINLTNLTCWNK